MLQLSFSGIAVGLVPHFRNEMAMNSVSVIVSKIVNDIVYP
jgi:hypothetical protein